MSNKRHSVSDWILVLTLTCAVFLGFYIDKYEVDLRPTPRALFNLAGAYYQRGMIKQAVYYWKMVIDYKTIYGIDYGNTQPHGRLKQRATVNLRNLNSYIKDDPLIRRGK